MLEAYSAPVERVPSTATAKGIAGVPIANRGEPAGATGGRWGRGLNAPPPRRRGREPSGRPAPWPKACIAWTGGEPGRGTQPHAAPGDQGARGGRRLAGGVAWRLPVGPPHSRAAPASAVALRSLGYAAQVGGAAQPSCGPPPTLLMAAAGSLVGCAAVSLGPTAPLIPREV